MDNNIIITKLEKKDLSSLKDLIKEAFNITISLKEVEQSLSDSSKIYIIARDNNKVVGHILINIMDDNFLNIRKFYLGYVCVKEEYKGKGIGTNLLKYVEDLAIKLKINVIEFTSSFDRCAAHNLYKKNNYQIRDTAVFIKNVNN